MVFPLSQNDLCLVFGHIEIGSGPEVITEIPEKTPLPRSAMLRYVWEVVEVVTAYPELAVVVEQDFAAPAGKVFCRTMPQSVGKEIGK